MIFGGMIRIVGMSSIYLEIIVFVIKYDYGCVIAIFFGIYSCPRD